MKISAIVCTYNGQKVLKTAIQSLVDQTLAKKDYEILVVDNASTDNTRMVVRQFETEENLRYIFEPNLGLSNARNTGWQKAHGKFIAYLDDDAIACPEWLERIIDAFRTVPEAGAIGGRVDPIWEEPRPDWLSERMMVALSVINWSDVPIFLGQGQCLVGANIAFPRKLLEQVGGFSSELGRKGNNLLSNEENLLVSKIKEQGVKVFYHPQIIVDHLIPASRLRKNWFKKRYFWQGVSDAILNYREKTITRKDKFLVIKSQCLPFIIRPKSIFNLLIPSNDKNTWDEKKFLYQKLGYMKGILSLNSLEK
jgi:glycosyltransferase involved in cell wall biosynthesis